ncbi:MAG: homocysteine S-methyltransferase family protein, partial [Bacteroidia bacterium]|nr:homocysteine S-methyltransferase family protein [Bacteroidia bacterium]
MANADIHIEIKKRILVLDGAMGTMIQSYNLNEKDFRGARFINHSCPLKGNNDLLSLTRAEIIYDIHSSYLEAGADIIETNTFNANRISMADYRLENLVYEMNVASAKIARSAADKYTMSQIPNPKSQIPNNNPDKPRFVAGSIGPTNKSASLSPDVNRPAFRAVTFDDLKNAYYEQAKGLFDGGVDILLVETIFDALNAKAALFAIEELFEHTEKRLPVMLSATISDTSGRILSGQTIEAFLISVSHIKPFSIGFNCAFGAGTILRYLEELSSKAPFYISAYPNAGLPDQFGKYKETPEYFTGRIKEFFVRGLVNIIGGCCGTTPEHIRAIAKVASEARPRIIPGIAPRTQFSGLEPLSVSKENNFINIGERTNVAGSRKFARLIYEKKYEEALSIARQQAEAGAQMLDVCLDAPMLNAETEIIVFLNLLASDPDIARPPVMLDSSKWTVIEAGLKCLQGKAIVNSISLKDGEESFLDRAKQIRRYGAAVVVMAFDEQGQAVTYERKIQVCKRA